MLKLLKALVPPFGCKRSIQYLAAFTANMGIFSSEMHYGWSSPYIPILVSGNYTFQITSEEASWMVVTPLVAAIVGALIVAQVGNMLGRKTFLIFSAFPLILSWLSVALARSSTLIFVGRFLSGLMDGLSFTIVPMYVAEIADPEIRGFLGSFCALVPIIAILSINIISLYLPLDTVAYISISVPVFFLLTFWWMPESPYFYLFKGKYDEARNSLIELRGDANVEEELNRIAKGIQEDKANKGKQLDLILVKSNRRAVYIAFSLRIIQQLGGLYVMVAYCHTVFEETGDILSPDIATILYFLIKLVVSFVASFTVDFSGRRTLLIFSTICTAITLFLNATFLYIKTIIDLSRFNVIPIIILLCYNVLYSIGLATIPELISSELFPMSVKSYALSYMDITYSLVVTCVAKFFHWTNESFGMYVPFYTFSLCCFLGSIFMIISVPETKRKTLEDIQTDLRKN